MKTQYVLFLVIMACAINNTINAQFIRIYNLQGKKTGKGTIELIADTVIVITNNKKQLQRFLVTEIGIIKTKKSVGHDVAAGFTIGVVATTWLADKIIENTEEIGDKGWNAIGIGMASGIALGTITGLISGITNKRQKFIINGDIEAWKEIAKQWFGYKDYNID